MKEIKGATPYYDNSLGIVYAMESGEIIVLKASDCLVKQLNDEADNNAEKEEYLTIDTPEFGILALYPVKDGIRLVPAEKGRIKRFITESSFQKEI